MIILIDGYNVLKHANSDVRIDEQERRQFIQMLSTYQRRKQHSSVLVFDGGPSTWPSKEIIAKVKVIYSGSKKSADKVIMEYIKDHYMKDLLLVSSDNELAHFANTHDVVSIGSEEFYYLMQEALRAPFESEIMEDVPVAIDDSIEDVDELMEAASGVVPLKPEDGVNAVRHQASIRSISKQERALLKKLQKL